MQYRKVTDVYKQIKPLIQDSNHELVKDLDKYINSLWNIAPEELSTGYFWKPFLDILNSYNDEIDDNQRVTIVKILSNEN